MLSRAEKKTLKIFAGVGLIVGILYAWRGWMNQELRAGTPDLELEQERARQRALPEVIIYER